MIKDEYTHIKIKVELVSSTLHHLTSMAIVKMYFRVIIEMYFLRCLLLRHHPRAWTLQNKKC
jgi:hypothetical protein